MDRKISSRRISKFKRRTLGDPDTFIHDILQKPVLTKRDKQVLLAIYFHRCLTTEQITEMFFKYDSKGLLNSQASIIARRRLRKLFDYCLVDRFFIDVGENNGSSQAHIILDTVGARVVAGLLNLKMEEINWRYEMTEVRLPYLEHMVKINQFYVDLLNGARERGHEVVNFMTENHIRHDFTYWGKKMTFIPDAYGQYWHGDDGFHFFLEMDNGTMTPGVFGKKHQRYSAFYASGEYEKSYDNFPLVLTITTSVDRVETLRRAVTKVDDTDMIWLFTSEDQFKKDPLGSIWLELGADEPVSLI